MNCVGLSELHIIIHIINYDILIFIAGVEVGRSLLLSVEISSDSTPNFIAFIKTMRLLVSAQSQNVLVLQSFQSHTFLTDTPNSPMANTF